LTPREKRAVAGSAGKEGTAMGRKIKFWLFRYSFSILGVILVVVLISIVCWFAQEVQEAEGAWRAMLLTISGSSLVGAYFLQKQKLAEIHLMKELITDFNKRYDALNGPLQDILRAGRKTPAPKLTQCQQKTLVDYFNLCAEEYLFYDLGYIEPRVWQAWRCGMTAHSSQDLRIFALWEQEPKASYYGFTFPK